MENKNFLKRFISIGLTSAIAFSVCTPNCFAMKRVGASYGGGNVSRCNRQVYGPPKPQPKLHTKWIMSDVYTWEHTYSWVDIGIDVASIVASVAGAGMAVTAARAAGWQKLTKASMPIISSLAEKEFARETARRATLSSVGKSAVKIGSLLGIGSNFSNDVRATRGVKVVVQYRIRRGVDCKCAIGANHGESSLIEIVSTSCNIF